MPLPSLLAVVVSTALAAPSPVIAPADSVRPDLDVRMVAVRHAGEVRHCYETAGLKRNPLLGGEIEVELRVLPTGRVDSAAVASSELAGLGKHEVEACVLTVVRNWRFERGPYRTEMIVYPFTFVRDERLEGPGKRSA